MSNVYKYQYLMRHFNGLSSPFTNSPILFCSGSDSDEDSFYGTIERPMDIKHPVDTEDGETTSMGTCTFSLCLSQFSFLNYKAQLLGWHIKKHHFVQNTVRRMMRMMKRTTWSQTMTPPQHVQVSPTDRCLFMVHL